MNCNNNDIIIKRKKGRPKKIKIPQEVEIKENGSINENPEKEIQP